MVKNIVVVILVVLFISGCPDTFYGPSIRSELNIPVNVIIQYKDGTVNNNIWIPCHESFVGRSSNIEDEVQSIEIRNGDKQLYFFDALKISNLLKREKEQEGNSVLVIRGSGIELLSNEAVKKCSKR